MRLWFVRLLALVAVLGAFVPGASAESGGYPAELNPPERVVGLGDSITQGFNADGSLGNQPANSWATGDNAEVNSHGLRIAGAERINYAVTGAESDEIASQVAQAVASNADYITVLIGANDACAASEAAMTPVEDYRAALASALDTVRSGLPEARVFVVSIPNVYHLWNTFKNNATARFVWSTFSICQSMLANPLSTEPADEERRQRVSARIAAYNAELEALCGAMLRCRYDGGLVYDTVFTAAQVSTLDYFHPSVVGQAALAAETFALTFDWSDTEAPVTAVAQDTSAPLTLVSLSATDNVAVDGIEYRELADTGWSVYSDTLSLAPATQIWVRAVDINGNTEAARLIDVEAAPVPEVYSVFVPVLMRP